MRSGATLPSPGFYGTIVVTAFFHKSGESAGLARGERSQREKRVYPNHAPDDMEEPLEQPSMGNTMGCEVS